MAQNQPDQEIEFYKEQVSQFRKEQFASLNPMEKLALLKSADKVKQVLVEKRQVTQISVEDLLDLVIIVSYFRKYGESPVQTAVTTPR